jgi:hypothetical protein
MGNIFLNKKIKSIFMFGNAFGRGTQETLKRPCPLPLKIVKPFIQISLFLGKKS